MKYPVKLVAVGATLWVANWPRAGRTRSPLHRFIRRPTHVSNAVLLQVYDLIRLHGGELFAHHNVKAQWRSRESCCYGLLFSPREGLGRNILQLFNVKSSLV